MHGAVVYSRMEYNNARVSISFIIIIIIITRTASHTTKYIHQRDSPPVRLLGGECIIPKSTQYVTVVTDITQ